MSLRTTGLLSLVALSATLACSGSEPNESGGGAGTSVLPSGGSAPVAGSSNPTGGSTTVTAGSGTGGSSNSVAGSGGNVATAGTDSGTSGSGNVAGTGTGGSAGGGSDEDPKPPRPIMVTGGGTFAQNFNGQNMFINKDLPPQGKLVLLLGGICTGTGAGGFESFVKKYGFHVFAPKTDTCVNSAPDQYKQTIKTTPLDMEANRQVADARMELWDGKDRVDWVTVAKGNSILEETVAAINFGMQTDPGADWGYYLNSDGTLRTTDVWVVGYSWGSQSWAMMSSYVRFGRVIVTSGPVAEGFPDGEWITHPSPSGTPANRKYMLVGLKMPYPSADAGDKGDMDKFTNVTKAGWSGTVTNVMPTGTGTYTADQFLFAMIGSNATSPGGHTVFCNDNPMNGWLPVCKHVLGVQ
ncbi:MAG TPA: hypothetical protein VHB79_32910 [Polyangiaceae bacterium]|nr:hypothetical protein [Polyangiaceae bacterium]